MRLFNIVATAYRALRSAPGKAVVVQLETQLGEQREIELYQLPGVASSPTPGDKIATINLGGYRIGIATQNYRVDLDVAAGTTTVYSTNAAGDAVQAQIRLGADGLVSISNTTGDLTTVLNDLIDELIAFKTFGSPTSHATDPSTIANLNLIKTALGQILQEAP